MLSHFSCVQLVATLWIVAHQALLSWDSLGKNTGVGCHVLLQGIFRPMDQTLVSYVSCIGRWVLFHWCHLGDPYKPLKPSNLSGVAVGDMDGIKGPSLAP